MHGIEHMFPVLSLYYADPAQHLLTTGWIVDDLDDDPSIDNLPARCVQEHTLAAYHAIASSRIWPKNDEESQTDGLP